MAAVFTTIYNTNFNTSCKRANLQKHEKPYLPEEVIEDILVRLPLKSILRFKSICKNWYSLIQSRCFIDHHRAHHRHDDHRDELFFSRNHSKHVIYTTVDEPYVVSSLSKSSIMERGQSTKLAELPILRRELASYRVQPPLMKFPFNLQSGIHVIGPLSNGISCVIAHEYVRTIDNKSCAISVHSKLALCNLATRQFNFIPYPFVRGGKRLPQRRNLTELNFLHQFGFCSFESPNGETTDYKIIGIEHNYKRAKLRASVYSHQRGSWEIVYDSSSSSLLSGLIISQHLNLFPVQALLHGCCHWIAGRGSRTSNFVIVQFDMAKEVFALMEAPPEDEYSPLLRLGYYLVSNVFVLDGCVAVLTCVVKDYVYERMDVWKMMKYGVGASWKKIFSQDVNVVEISRFLGMSFCDKTNDIERIFFEGDRKFLMSCDGSQVKKHRNFHPYWACWKPLGLAAFVETLEPV